MKKIIFPLLLLSFSIVGISQSFALPQEDMSYHFESDLDFPIDTTSNTNMTLASGSERPIWNSTGHLGTGAYEFSGSQYAIINVTNSNDLDDSPTTTSGWFRAESTGPNDYQTIFFGENSNSSDDYEIYLEPDGNLVFRLDASFTSRIATCTSNVDYRDDTWHHFIAVMPSDNDCKLYVDGEFQSQDFNSGSGTIVLSDVIQIGAYTISPVTDGFYGMLDDIIHWDNYDLGENDPGEILEFYYSYFGITVCESPPVSGDWIISNSCTLVNNETPNGNVIIQNNSVLTIQNNSTLTISSESNITIFSDNGVLIQNGGTIQINS